LLKSGKQQFTGAENGFISSGHGERQAAHTGCGNKEVMDNVDIQASKNASIDANPKSLPHHFPETRRKIRRCEPVHVSSRFSLRSLTLSWAFLPASCRFFRLPPARIPAIPPLGPPVRLGIWVPFLFPVSFCFNFGLGLMTRGPPFHIFRRAWSGDLPIRSTRLLRCLMDFGDLQRCKHGLKGRLGIDGFLKTWRSMIISHVAWHICVSSVLH